MLTLATIKQAYIDARNAYEYVASNNVSDDTYDDACDAYDVACELYLAYIAICN